MTEGKGRCPHGEFELIEGCAHCVAERRQSGIRPEQDEMEDGLNAKGLTFTALALHPGEDIEVQIEKVILARDNAQRAKEAKSTAYSAWEREYKSLLDSVMATSELLAEEESNSVR